MRKSVMREIVETFLQTESARERREKREKLFNRQVKILLEKGFPKLAGLSEGRFLEYVEPLKKHIHRAGNFFLIALPQIMIDAEVQFARTELNGQRGFIDFSALNPANLRRANGIIPPDVPYLIGEVESGRTTKGLDPRLCEKTFKSKGRSGFFVEEGVALVNYFPEILEHLFVNLLGHLQLPDRPYGAKSLPHIFLGSQGPTLSRGCQTGGHPQWGTPSCSMRIAP